ncbi:MAG: hypothetical protein JWM56_413 [Candidatus Peribacteria bacterium]|nr:hypothetical protein [Candidatus Peribacteria bacterium]
MTLPHIFSEEYIQEHCPHCDPASDAFSTLLNESEHFRIVCDHHPIIEGHILIIPKEHFSCLGDYPEHIFSEFIDQYERVRNFLIEQYGCVSAFEHGKIGQTVFHSHVHFLPYKGDPLLIISEGMEHLVALPSFVELRRLYKQYGRYLFFSIDALAWVVNPLLATPRFFRDRFALALDVSERGNWKNMHMNERLMATAQEDNARVKLLWDNGEICSDRLSRA